MNTELFLKLELPKITFKAHSKIYQIEPKEPINGVSYEEIQEKAKREVELYMLNNSIPGAYELKFL